MKSEAKAWLHRTPGVSLEVARLIATEFLFGATSTLAGGDLP
jgi:hypothetical protein